MSRMILPGEWDINLKLVTDSPKIAAAIEYWVHGVPWPTSGIYEYMHQLIKDFGGAADGCTNLQDIINRYEKLDNLFEKTKQGGGFDTRHQLGFSHSGSLEPGGIYFHVGRNGPVFAGDGHHRLGIALSLSLDIVPAQLGAIHPEGLKFLPSRLDPSK